MTAEEDEVPEVCGRCGGTGYVLAARMEDYYAEDSYPREVEMKPCPECGGEQ